VAVLIDQRFMFDANAGKITLRLTVPIRHIHFLLDVLLNAYVKGFLLLDHALN
jgi:hypothetical protein